MIRLDAEKCISCGLCVAVCPTRAFAKRGDRVVVTDAECIACFACEDVCPAGAIRVEV